MASSSSSWRHSTPAAKPSPPTAGSGRSSASRLTTRAGLRVSHWLVAGLLVLATSPLASSQQKTRDDWNDHVWNVVVEADRHLQAHRPQEAITILDELFALEDLTSSKTYAGMAYLRRARARRYLQDFEGAEEDLQQSEQRLQHGRGPNTRALYSNVFGIRGLIALDLGLLDIAQLHFDRQREILDEVLTELDAPPPEWFRANLNLTHLWLARTDFRLLEQRVDDWLEDPAYQSELGRREQFLLRVRQAYARKELEEADPDRPRRAEAQLEEVLPYLDPSEKVMPMLMLADIALERDDPGRCLEWLDQAAELLEPVSPTDGTTYNPLPAYWVCLQARRSRFGEAPLEQLVRWRDLLRAQVDSYAASLADRPLRPAGYGPLHFGATLALLHELVALEIRLDPGPEGHARALEHLFRLQALGSLARHLEAPVPTLEEIREEVLGGPGHGVIQYLPGQWETRVLLVDADGVEIVLLPPDTLLKPFRRALVRSLLRSPSPDNRKEQAELARALADQLLPPELLQKVAGWKHWSFIGTDLLGEVPFEMLPYGDGILGAERMVDRLPSLPVALAMARRATAVDTPWDTRLILASRPSDAALELVEDLPALPLDTQLFIEPPDGQRWEILGPERSGLSSLQTKEMPASKVIQFVAHAVADASRERPMALALAEEGEHDGLMRPADVEASASPELVILAACRAGRTPLRAGDPGAADLSGAFIRAGARAVILSHWDLELETVRRLSTVLHRELAFGVAPAEALRRARAELLADDRFADPALFGGLQVVGLGGVPVFESGPDGIPGHELTRGTTDVRQWLLIGAATLAVIAVLAAMLGRLRRRRGAG